MPSTNHFKFGASDISSATRGGFKVGVVGGAEYGPTSLTGFWNGVTPPVGGYTIYVDKASQGPSIHVANNDAQCIFKLKAMGATGTTIEDVLAWADGQSNMAVLSAELTLGDLPGGATPTPQPTSTPTPTPEPTTYTIGQSALGGIIAYINGGGSTGTSGLVVTSSDVGSAVWGCADISITTSESIGTGNANTLAIVAGCTTSGIAAKVCNDLVEGGYSDWYLPSYDELVQLYNNYSTFGMSTVRYWSSSQIDTSNAKALNFALGFASNRYKDAVALSFRAVRSF